MGNLCINCSEPTEGYEDFCSSCEETMHTMVDANVRDTEGSIIDTNVDPLFQKRTITGKILDNEEEMVYDRIKTDKTGNSGFWSTIIILMLVMVVIFVVSN
ncbi:MAG: hypothetical protein ACW98K_11855 [Candidatus Kariarchaeaceae archaeon]|jgi:hypothetical protein